jgi:hypothetical protein
MNKPLRVRSDDPETNKSYYSQYVILFTLPTCPNNSITGESVLLLQNYVWYNSILPSSKPTAKYSPAKHIDLVNTL